MDLTLAMGKIYLAHVNPLLGEIVGLAIGEKEISVAYYYYFLDATQCIKKPICYQFCCQTNTLAF
jgi:hypothetical protein